MKNLPERKKRVLCSNVQRADNLLNDIMLRLAPESDSYAKAYEVKKTIGEIHLQALAMEKRLYLYKETIEGLGFKRVRTK